MEKYTKKQNQGQKNYAKTMLLLHSHPCFLLFVYRGEVQETQHSFAASLHIDAIKIPVKYCSI